MPATFSLIDSTCGVRPAVNADRAAFIALFSEAIQPLLAQSGLSDEQCALVVESQFEQQGLSYRERFPGLVELAITNDNDVIGRMVYCPDDPGTRLLDVSVRLEHKDRMDTILRSVAASADFVRPISYTIEQHSHWISYFEAAGFEQTPVDNPALEFTHYLMRLD